MTPYYSDEWLTILEGDCRAVLPSLPADSVDCVVTSPPYWGLRDYGTATWSGGDDACDHTTVGPGRAQRPAGGLTGGKAHVDAGTVKGGDCGRCGATRMDQQLGLERTPEEYVANMVAVFAEVRRVLKPSGTCWLNLGDSYNTAGTRQGNGKGGIHGDGPGTVHRAGYRGEIPGLKPKDLVGIPWRVAFALQADGWYLRFAVFPPELPERCIKAGSSERGVCPECGAPWERVVERTNESTYARIQREHGITYKDMKAEAAANGVTPGNVGGTHAPGRRGAFYESPGNVTTGWRPTCNHSAGEANPDPEMGRSEGNADGGIVVNGLRATSPAVILDPFAGSGTVGVVANRLSRRAILIDLNPEYLRQQMTRNAQTPLGLGAA